MLHCLNRATLFKQGCCLSCLGQRVWKSSIFVPTHRGKCNFFSTRKNLTTSVMVLVLNPWKLLLRSPCIDVCLCSNHQRGYQHTCHICEVVKVRGIDLQLQVIKVWSYQVSTIRRQLWLIQLYPTSRSCSCQTLKFCQCEIQSSALSSDPSC